LYANDFNTANAGYFDTFQTITGWNPITVKNVIHNPNSLMTYFMMNEVEAPIYAHYSSPGVDGGICNSQVVSQCAFSNLTYNQWLRGSVLLYPLPGMDIPITSVAYTIQYSGYSLLQYPPEVYYFQTQNGNDIPKEVTIFDTYQALNSTGLYNAKIMQDIFYDYNDTNWSNVFTSPSSKPYLRYMALNLGLGGLFMQLTPR
jgi:hypothetical protein